MKIQLGFDLTYSCTGSTPMILMLNVHPSRAGDLITPDRLRLTPTRSSTTFGTNVLKSFSVTTHKIEGHLAGHNQPMVA